MRLIHHSLRAGCRSSRHSRRQVVGLASAILALLVATAVVGAAVQLTANETYGHTRIHYDWINGDGYAGWSSSSDGSGSYGLQAALGGRPGLWIWPEGGLYKPGGAGWDFRSPGSARIASADLTIEYRPKFLAKHCIVVELRSGTTSQAITRICQPEVPGDQVATTAVALKDPAAIPTSDDLSFRVELPPCSGTSDDCTKNLSSLDPLTNGPYVRLRDVSLVVVDQSPPTVNVSGALIEGLSDKLRYFNGSETLPFKIDVTDPDLGVTRVELIERHRAGTTGSEGIPRLESSLVASTDAQCDQSHKVEALGPRICPSSLQLDGVIDLSRLSEGQHEFEAVAVDAAGNRGSSGPWSIEIDRTPPAPVAAVDIDTFERSGSYTVLAWDPPEDPSAGDGTAGSGVIAYEYRTKAGNTDWTSWTSTENRGARIDGVSAGTGVRIELRAQDAAGNTSTAAEFQLTLPTEDFVVGGGTDAVGIDADGEPFPPDFQPVDPEAAAPVPITPTGPAQPGDYTSDYWTSGETETPHGLHVVSTLKPGTFAVSGVVQDTTGNPIPGATVRLTPTGSDAFVLTTTSDDHGGYAFSDVPGGFAGYDETIAATGFRTYQISEYPYQPGGAYQATDVLEPATANSTRVTATVGSTSDESRPTEPPAEAVAEHKTKYTSNRFVPSSTMTALFHTPVIDAKGAGAGRAEELKKQYGVGQLCSTPDEEAYGHVVHTWDYYGLHVPFWEIGREIWPADTDVQRANPNAFGPEATLADLIAQQSYTWYHELRPFESGSSLKSAVEGGQCYDPFTRPEAVQRRAWRAARLSQVVVGKGRTIQETQYAGGEYFTGENCRQGRFNNPDSNKLQQLGAKAWEDRCNRNAAFIVDYYYTGKQGTVAPPEPPNDLRFAVHIDEKQPGAPQPGDKDYVPAGSIKLSFKKVDPVGSKRNAAWGFYIERKVGSGPWKPLGPAGILAYVDWDSRRRVVPTSLMFNPKTLLLDDPDACAFYRVRAQYPNGWSRPAAFNPAPLSGKARCISPKTVRKLAGGGTDGPILYITPTLFTDSGNPIGNRGTVLMKLPPAGPPAVALTSNADFTITAAWSPDYERIAIVQVSPNGNTHTQLLVTDANGQNPVVISDGRSWQFSSGPRGPAFSPDGTKIAYSEPAPPVGRAHIFIANADGSPSPTMLGEGSRASWIDNQTVAYMDRTAGFAIVRQRIDGSGRAVIADGSLVWSPGSTSPDGSRYAFVCDENSGDSICLVATDGSQANSPTRIQLPADIASAGPDAVAFSPDGSKLSFSTQPGFNQTSLYDYVMDANGQNVRRVGGEFAYTGVAAWNTTSTALVGTFCQNYVDSRTGSDGSVVSACSGSGIAIMPADGSSSQVIVPEKPGCFCWHQRLSWGTNYPYAFEGF